MGLNGMHVPLSAQAVEAAAIEARSFIPSIENGAIVEATPIVMATAAGAALPALEIIPCSPACRLSGDLIPPGCTLPPYDGDLPPNAPI